MRSYLELALLSTVAVSASVLTAAGSSTADSNVVLDGGIHVRADVSSVCSQIGDALSSASALYYPGSINYLEDNYHWLLSSSQSSTCTVEPGTASDVGEVLQILGATNTSFAIKGGGHASNPGFSSTTGVHIDMSRFSSVTYNAGASTADVGAGLVWDDVYQELQPHGVVVVGGRVSGIGVAGFTLGGGYSWLTSQYGLTVDNVVGFELVLPNGTVMGVTEGSNPDLMFALKGGYNNFGIVTQITLKTYPIGQIWGGLITYTENTFPQLAQAVANFSENNTDPKAQILTTYNSAIGFAGVTQVLFYDAPTPPDGLFDQFMAIPYFTKDVGTMSFLDLVKLTPSNATANTRGVFNTVSILDYSVDMLNVIANETTYWGSELTWASGFLVSFDVEPFLPSLFSHGTTSASAYPPSRAQPLLPLNLCWTWLDEADDERFWEAITQSADNVKAKAVSFGQNVGNAPLYGNYAIFSTPLEYIFGDQLARLQSIKQRYDPGNVMGLTGGWKVQV